MNILTQNYLTRGFWGDEAWTALISQFSIPEIVRITGEDFHPPFYYFLVHGFIQIFGASEWIRLLSTGFWLLTAVPVYLLAKKLINHGVAKAAAALVLSSPILFTYAFEARAYALVTFISAFSTLAFWNCLETKAGRWWLVYLALGVVGVYSHYYMWFVFLSHGVYWLVLDRKQFKKVLLVYGAMLVAQLPWLPTLLSQVGSVVKDYWIGAMDKRTHWEFFMRLAGGDFDTPQRMFAVVSLLVMLTISGLGMVWKKRRLPKGYMMLWLWLMIPVIVPSLISLYRPVFFYRYLIFTAIPMILIMLWGLQKWRFSLACGAAAYLLAVYLSINWLSFGRYPQTMREKMEQLNQKSNKPVTKIVTVLPSFAEVMFYNQTKAPVEVLPEGLVQSSGKSLLDAFVRAGKVKVKAVDESEAFWLIEPGPKASWHSPVGGD